MNYKELYEQVCEQLNVLSSAYERDCCAKEFYGFFHTDSIYESGYVLVSLHKTKKGAVRAMISHQHKAWEKAQQQGRHWTRKEIKKFRQEDSEWDDWSRKDDFWRKAYVHKASKIMNVSVFE